MQHRGVRHAHLQAIGVILCLLAVLFAVEAKVAWFGPNGSPAELVSASKLAPADAPKLVAQALTAPEPVLGFPNTLILLPLLFVLLASLLTRKPTRDLFGLAQSPSFAHQLFFRPPPRA